ncbi:uncharacterized protein J7T54_002700 [Emericellopsis cladophorae]|uniref:Xylanolytic transcriptional activator regulatory domain-containing protein n=1 Tax=Emericellopsis cladophorae TaxID=2686198 RepID=A0A9P9XUV4_9HYPO|nr:uncharacterized protein J7T54_002700 [Emericellopsis cladophorae]KAI6778165.1 hypothetical protein J7T54_002700 [Emericellopsis cladophorae]
METESPAIPSLGTSLTANEEESTIIAIDDEATAQAEEDADDRLNSTSQLIREADQGGFGNGASISTSPAASWAGSLVEQPPLTALQRWQRLSLALSLANADPDQIVSRCIDLFFKYLYPLTPLVHEPGLRSDLDKFASGSSISEIGAWRADSAFTLITAVCAEAVFLLPSDVFPESTEAVGHIFLRASRDCLHSYLEADLESPDANSLAIRYFHSNCIHATGKPKYSWHIFGEATRLAQAMQLHQESSLEGLTPVEAEFRRRAFWIVYMGDKSAAILNNRPITLHRFSFDEDLTTAFPMGLEHESWDFSAVSPDTPSSLPMQSSSLITGFNANLQLWQAASELLLELRLLQDTQRDSMVAGLMARSAPSVEQRQRLDALHVHFTTCLDELPAYLQSCTLATASGQSLMHTTQLVIQCANLQVSFHCLRMVITQRFEDMSYYGTSLEQADLRRTEIARDMLRVMQEAPFWSLQVNGEPYVEKIRLIGASLLAIVHRNPGSPLATRARADFMVLLDTLTRLDSKASDALRSNMM